MGKKVAVLDLGTNTFHLLIAEVEPGEKPNEILKESISAKIGEGGITQGFISDQAFARGIDALKKFRIIIDETRVDRISAVGTAALRSARNGQEFIDRAKIETNISVALIDGDREAELIYEGVRQAVKLPRSPVLIVDIGGGSVEFILCNSDQILWKKSYPIGAAKLMALFHHTDPISHQEINTIVGFLDEQLSELKTKCGKFKPATLIGSAGSFETFAEQEVLQYSLDPQLLQQTEFSFNMSRFYAVADLFLRSTHEERAKMRGLPEVRVNMIIVSAILTRYLLKELNIAEMKLSTYSLKEGLLFAGG